MTRYFSRPLPLRLSQTEVEPIPDVATLSQGSLGSRLNVGAGGAAVAPMPQPREFTCCCCPTDIKLVVASPEEEMKYAMTAPVGPGVGNKLDFTVGTIWKVGGVHAFEDRKPGESIDYHGRVLPADPQAVCPDCCQVEYWERVSFTPKSVESLFTGQADLYPGFKWDEWVLMYPTDMALRAKSQD